MGDAGQVGSTDGGPLTDGANGSGDGSMGTDGPPPFDGGGLTDGPSNAPDASPKGTPPDGGFDPSCQTALGWWAGDASIDGARTPGTFAAEVNKLLPGQHPITLADYTGDGGAWMLRASGTDTNGGFQQYFPAQHGPLVDVPMMLGTNDFQSGAAGAGFLKIVDGAQNEVWVQLDQVMVSAAYGDTFCQTLVNGTMSAVIDAAAGSTAIITSGGTSTTVGALLGTQNSTSPAGWTMAMTFDGQKVQVTFK